LASISREDESLTEVTLGNLFVLIRWTRIKF